MFPTMPTREIWIPTGSHTFLTAAGSFPMPRCRRCGADCSRVRQTSLVRSVAEPSTWSHLWKRGRRISLRNFAVSALQSGMLCRFVLDHQAEIYKKAGIHFASLTHLGAIGLVSFNTI